MPHYFNTDPLHLVADVEIYPAARPSVTSFFEELLLSLSGLEG